MQAGADHACHQHHSSMLIPHEAAQCGPEGLPWKSRLAKVRQLMVLQHHVLPGLQKKAQPQRPQNQALSEAVSAESGCGSNAKAHCSLSLLVMHVMYHCWDKYCSCVNPDKAGSSCAKWSVAGRVLCRAHSRFTPHIAAGPRLPMPGCRCS